MNNKLKITLIAALVLCISVSFAAPACAVTTLLVNNGIANYASTGGPTLATTAGSGYAYLFSGNGQFLSSASFWIKNSTNTMSGILMACLYLNPITNASLANSSTTVNLADLTWDDDDTATGYRQISFNFSVTNQLTEGVNYWLGLVQLTSTGSGVVLGRSGNTVSRSTRIGFADWSTGNNNPLLIEIYTSNVYGGEVPLPTAGAYPISSTDELIETFAGYLVPLVLFLLPAFLLGYVTKWQKWPILIGLAIGSGLTYLFLGAAYVWLVFLVVIGMVGMAYQSMRGGGDHK